MNVLLDNSSFRSIYRCLKREAKSPEDLEDLLQFINSYVLADIIYIPGFVHDKVKAQVLDGLQELEANKILVKDLQFTSENEGEFKELCKITTNNFLTFFSSAKLTLDNGELPLKGYRAINASVPEHDMPHTKDIHYLVNTIEDAGIFKDIEVCRLSDHEFGAVGYMIASNEIIRDFINAYRESWTLKTTYQLIAILRYYLNETISDNNQSDYLPNVTRAKIIEENNARFRQCIIELISNGLLSPLVKEEIFDKYPRIPTFSKAILYKSKGDIGTLLDLAIEARHEAKELRRNMGNCLADAKSKGIDLWHEIEKEIYGLVRVVSNQLKLDQSITEHIELKIISGIPVPGNKLLCSLENWFKKVKNKKAVSLITEYANVLNSPVKDNASFEKMYRAISKYPPTPLL